MKRVLWALVFAVVGVCIGTEVLMADRLVAEVSGIAGEDDFDRRFRDFLLKVCPAFVLLGAWIMHLQRKPDYWRGQ